MSSGRRARFAWAVAVASLGACGGSSSTVPGGDPATVELSDDDVGFTSLNATVDLDATVRDAGGKMIAANVAWTTDASSVASVTSQGVVTAVGNGTTRVIATAGTVADTATVTVQQVAAQLTLTPDTLELAVGDTATVTATVRDAGGSPMTGVGVTFFAVTEDVASVDGFNGRVTAHGNGATWILAQTQPLGEGPSGHARVEVGSFLPPAYLVGGYVGTPYTDQIPAASGGTGFQYWVTDQTLPDGLSLNASTGAITGTPTEPGVHFFEVTAINATLSVSERYAITISAKPADAFNLWIAYDGGPMPPLNARTALANAVVRWEEIVTGDAGQPVTYPSDVFEPDAACSALVDGTLFNGATIDDVAILVSIVPIDGFNDTLAQAGPCGPGRPEQPVVLQGQMRIDRQDAQDGSASFLEDVIIHEIGHVLGIGTLWQSFTEFEGTDSVRYFGPNAKAEWNALGGSGDVPVEPEVSAHWDESWFDDEIMTPFAEDPGTPNPLSRVTIGVLMDFEWSVSLDAADGYTLRGCNPICTAPPRAPGRGERPTDVVIEPLLPLPPGVLRD